MHSDGSEEFYTYDAEGNVTSITNRLGKTTRYEYDALNRRVRTIGPGGVVTETVFDAVGREIAREDGEGNRTEFEYDAGTIYCPDPVVFRKLGSQPRMTAMVDPEGNRIEYTYDANGNPIGSTDPNGEVSATEYDAMNRPTGSALPDGRTTDTVYDPAGQITSAADANGRTVTYGYDPLGRTVAVTDDLGNVTSYTYDELGNRISQTDANGHTTRWEYDNEGRMVRHTLPMGMSESFVYDDNGDLVRHTDFRGLEMAYEYDRLGRVVREVGPGGEEVVRTYRDDGTPDTVVDARGTTRYEYDEGNRLLRVVQPDGTEVSYGYNAGGEFVSVTSPAGTTSYTADALGSIKTVTDPLGRVTTYENAGRTTTVTYPNGTTATTTADELGQIVEVVNAAADGTVLSGYTYSYAPDGTSMTVTEHDGRTVTYTYDDLHRLIREAVSDPAGDDYAIDYEYDPVGNRIRETHSSEGVTTYDYDANDRLTTVTSPAGTTTYTYDANGNMLSTTDAAGTTTHEYDVHNRMIRTVTAGGTVIGYTYDAEGHRVAKTVDGVRTRYVIDANRRTFQVLAELDDAGNVKASYVYGFRRISQDRGGQTSYYHYDGQNSTRLLTDGAEAVTDTYDYTAGGRLTASTGATDNAFLYNGQQYDAASGLYYLRSRYLDTDAGRFLSVDPMAGNLHEPITLNKYLYANADPTTYADPNGHFGIFLGLAHGIGIWSSVITAVNLSRTLDAYMTLQEQGKLYNNNVLTNGTVELSIGFAQGSFGTLGVGASTEASYDIKSGTWSGSVAWTFSTAISMGYQSMAATFTGAMVPEIGQFTLSTGVGYNVFNPGGGKSSGVTASFGHASAQISVGTDRQFGHSYGTAISPVDIVGPLPNDWRKLIPDFSLSWDWKTAYSFQDVADAVNRLNLHMEEGMGVVEFVRAHKMEINGALWALGRLKVMKYFASLPAT
ncbi:MAG: RHS repeat-associated core domain-containing protein [Planctomycetota bacterium]